VHARDADRRGKTVHGHESAASRLARLTDGSVVTQLLWVADELRIADVLVGGPRTAKELATQVGAVLRRVLRGLAAEEILEELPGGRVGLTTVRVPSRRTAARHLSSVPRSRSSRTWRRTSSRSHRR
jgi:hypothetical protein